MLTPNYCGASSGLAVLKFTVGVFTGSLGLIVEATHSLLDLVSNPHHPARNPGSRDITR
jgi:hypothetical protein